MAPKLNFMRQFSNAYDGVKTSGDITLLPLYSSIEETILAAEYTAASPEVVKFYYQHTDLTDKALGEIYYKHFPKPANVKGVGEVMQPQSVRNKRKSLSDQMYSVFGDDFFKVLISDANYKEVNWRKNVINHKFYDVSRLVSSDANQVLRGIASSIDSGTNSSTPDNFGVESSGRVSDDSVDFEQSSTGTYGLDECKTELDFIYRYLDPALVLASNRLDPKKVAYLLSVMEGTVDKNLPGSRLDVLEQILSRSVFARPVIEGV